MPYEITITPPVLHSVETLEEQKKRLIAEAEALVVAFPKFKALLHIPTLNLKWSGK